ncbi:hypothetical protein POSPLADRAFT_1049008 [Postia placenta MAD-698-R-SB12]|uniref:Lytic polysaccharide monooxygenase n=1 Tax=Postia placenta MAD-698-R-SB12 TaxID=670580 RepID=A0A1X6MR05_9APHY|nr:hypothetical protein POSPLADRAFT_1049008 [Postia placenta MAD-698-R-SB12]OSX58817.1 hypothetical protein POSPLADRAFT_1049008 [Postia placenta MAD-698-R-SB12]
MINTVPAVLALAAFVPLASAHIAFWDKSMYGFNVTQQDYSYDNRPVTPLVGYTFDQWWFHGHLDHPPLPGDTFDLPAGGTINSQLSCDKGATVWYNSSSGGDAGYGSNWPCPGQQSSQFHTTGIDDVMGCALAIAYKGNGSEVQPDDFTIFSVNQTCVWYLNTEFAVPAEMPACGPEGCTCAWFWIHSDKSGAEQMYMNGFSCNVTGATGTTPIGKSMLPRRCGADSDQNEAANPGNCTIGPKLPMYWMQAEGNNMNEGYYMPPVYNDIYGFHDGAQDDIFQDAYVSSLGASQPGVVPSATAAANRRAEIPEPVVTPPPASLVRRHKRTLAHEHSH